MRTLIVAAACVLRVRAGLYELSQKFVGGSTPFFDKFSFWQEPDPSHGAVKYVDRDVAAVTGLISETADRAYIGVETNSVAGARWSVRVESTDTYNAGLFIAKIDHVPTGCGTWPAFWMYGDDWTHEWPKWGEYDIIEGVHDMTKVMTSLHTTPHCDQSDVTAGVDFADPWEPGVPGAEANNCYIHAPDQMYNQGCSQQGPLDSMGAGFNAKGGGTYASEWNPDRGHLRTWFWPSGSEPENVAAGSPDPDSWGTPYSYFTLTSGRCSKRHLKNFRIVFNINLCGDLGGAKFAGSCPEIAKTMNCADFVTKHPERMIDAYWSIRALDVYQVSSQPAAGIPLTALPSVGNFGAPVNAPQPVAEVGPVAQPAQPTILNQRSSMLPNDAINPTHDIPSGASSVAHGNSRPSRAGNDDSTGSFLSNSNPTSGGNDDTTSGGGLQANDVVHWLLGLGLFGWISFWVIQLLHWRAQSSGADAGDVAEVSLIQNPQSSTTRAAQSSPLSSQTRSQSRPQNSQYTRPSH